MKHDFLSALRRAIWLRATRRSARARRRILAARAARDGPPAVRRARDAIRDRADIEIDPLETQFAPHARGLAVRAWVIVPAGSMPDAVLYDIARAWHQLLPLPPRAARIFYLATSYGAKQADIAALLGIGKRRVRRELLDVIAQLDRRADQSGLPE
ncbi:hypothetical protein BH10PSE12_BH10PSE12_07970 [soil metagenome]